MIYYYLIHIIIVCVTCDNYTYVTSRRGVIINGSIIDNITHIGKILFNFIFRLSTYLVIHVSRYFHKTNLTKNTSEYVKISLEIYNTVYSTVIAAKLSAVSTDRIEKGPALKTCCVAVSLILIRYV